MWSSFIDSSKSLSLEENEAILTFVRRSMSFICKCIQYNIIIEQSPDTGPSNHDIRWNSVLDVSLPDTATAVKSTLETEGDTGYDNDRETTASELLTPSVPFSLVTEIGPI